jgi:hypothetical protein
MAAKGPAPVATGWGCEKTLNQPGRTDPSGKIQTCHHPPISTRHVNPQKFRTPQTRTEKNQGQQTDQICHQVSSCSAPVAHAPPAGAGGGRLAGGAAPPVWPRAEFWSEKPGGRAGVFGLSGEQPGSGTHYRVAIRGQAPGQNFCSCPDFATNDLGTCKHIEFTLAKLQAKRGGKAALKNGFAPTYSEIWLDYAGQRRCGFRAARIAPASLLKQAKTLFDAECQLGAAPRSNSTSWSTFCRPRRLRPRTALP